MNLGDHAKVQVDYNVYEFDESTATSSPRASSEV